MNTIFAWIKKLNWGIVLLLCVVPGLAPYTPPHLFEKLAWLFTGALTKWVDWFDLFFHGFPWILALTKLWLLRPEK